MALSRRIESRDVKSPPRHGQSYLRDPIRQMNEINLNFTKSLHSPQYLPHEGYSTSKKLPNFQFHVVLGLSSATSVFSTSTSTFPARSFHSLLNSHTKHTHQTSSQALPSQASHQSPRTSYHSPLE